MLEELKIYLNITWDDEDIDKKLKLLILESKEAINILMGIDVDYSKVEFKELLFNRIRYAYNNSLEYFLENFRQDILLLQLKVGVQENEK